MHIKDNTQKIIIAMSDKERHVTEIYVQYHVYIVIFVLISNVCELKWQESLHPQNQFQTNFRLIIN